MEHIGKVIQNIKDEASRNNPASKSDFYEDGLLYCGTCGKPKECKVKILGKLEVVPCICKCTEEQMAKEKERLARNRIEDLRDRAFSSKKQHSYTFDNDDGANPELIAVCKNYVNHFSELRHKGKGLLLYGSVGTGKTYASCAIANALIEEEKRVYVTSISKIVSTLQALYEKDVYIKSLCDYNLVVIDDLGIERNSEFMQEMLYNIINALYEAKVPLIITTNLTIDEIKNPVTDWRSRIYDRILERCFPYEAKGKSHRRKNLREDYAETKKLLGLGE